MGYEVFTAWVVYVISQAEQSIKIMVSLGVPEEQAAGRIYEALTEVIRRGVFIATARGMISTRSVAAEDILAFDKEVATADAEAEMATWANENLLVDGKLPCGHTPEEHAEMDDEAAAEMMGADLATTEYEFPVGFYL